MNTADFILLDGAMGTMLQAAGLPAGGRPELLSLTAPDTVTAVHRAYAQAGSRVLYANTFGANRKKLTGSGYTPEQVITAAVIAAKEALKGEKTLTLDPETSRGLPVPLGDGGVKVALDVGPIGELMEPLGALRFDEAYDIYREMAVAGEKAGADLVVFETMGDLAEVRAAVLAARENTSLPVWVTMTFQETGRTFLGCTVEAMGLTLSGLGVDALGFNCSLGPAELLPLAEELAHYTDLPLILKPNAGLPDPATGEYRVTAQAFAQALAKAANLGVRLMGGCCGTTPEFIRALAAALDGKRPTARRPADRHGVCSASRAARFGGVRVIGERVNPTGKKRLQQALREGDMAYVMRLGVEQEDAGADILDVNVGLPGLNEPETMARAVRALQSVTDLPLQIDSSDPAAIEAGLRAACGKAIVNSVNGDPKTLETVLPLCRKYGAAVVGLTMDERGIPASAQERVDIARRILGAALAHGIAKEDVLIDCLTLTVGAEQAQARETLEAVRRVREELGLHAVLGVSNISFGLPAREHVTVSFLTQAMHAGLDLPIVNPNSEAVMDAIAAYRVISGEDAGAAAYAHRFTRAVRAVPAPTSEGTAKNKQSFAHEAGTWQRTERAVPAPTSERAVPAPTSERAVPAPTSERAVPAPTSERAVPAPTSEGAVRNAQASAPVAGVGRATEQTAVPAPETERFDRLRAAMAEAVARGLGEDVAAITREALGTMGEMDAVNALLIPALDAVGERYERQELFLPQLIGAANAACRGFDVVKARIAARGAQAVSKGKIVLATVRGDIHDIGKNIVRVVLENYGYTVIDLGKDVPPETVADAAAREQAGLVGLSALMTTTVGSMEKTIALIHERGLPCKIMVGGAVLTEAYALSIGADYYAKDAKASADIAKKVLGEAQ